MMGNSPAKSAPPPYTAEEADRVAPDLVDRLQNIVQQRRGVSSACAVEVQRLRNFLTFALACDYKRKANVSLSSTDWEHYATIKNCLSDLDRSAECTNLTDAERGTLAPYFTKYLDEPCKALGIPLDYVCQAILDFFRFQGCRGQYKGAVFGILRAYGTSELASKLYIDRTVVIPRVIESADHRERLLTGVNSVGRLYFDSIDGMECSMVPHGPGGDGPTVQTPSYTLNERGRAYENQRRHSKAAIGEFDKLSPQHWRARVKLCMDKVVKRQSVFTAQSGSSGTMANGSGSASSWMSSRGWPVGWALTLGLHLPDFFEDRVHKGTSEG